MVGLVAPAAAPEDLVVESDSRILLVKECKQPLI
jgi:hypothetical protein